MASRGRSAPAPFRAMYSVLDDAAGLVTRYGSLSSAAERLIALERENAELRAALDKNSARVSELKARALMSPGQVVAVLQRECTCVGDVGLLGTKLAEALRPGDARSGKPGDRVILLVHQVKLDKDPGADEDSTPALDGTADNSAGSEPALTSPEDVRSSKVAREKPRRPRKRLRCGKRSGATPAPPPNVEPPQWTDRIQDRIRAWRTVVGSNGETSLDDAVGSSTREPRVHGAARGTGITRRDQIDTSPSSWTSLGVEVAISRLGEKALSWSPPEELMDAIEERQRDLPALTIEDFAALDEARPWDLIYLRRCDASFTFNYDALRSKGKAFVRAIRWFQFEFRRELWEWMHWIPMPRRSRSPEWETYRRGRNDRSVRALEAWDALCMDAIKLVRDELVPVDFFLDPSVWVMRYYQWLSWKPSATDLVAAQADEDARHPARSFYVTNQDEHPFFGSPFSHLYPGAHALPRLADAEGKREVHMAPADTGTRACPTSWGTTETAPVFRVVANRGNPSTSGPDVKPGRFG